MMSRLRNLVYLAFWIEAFGYLTLTQAQPTSQASNLQAFHHSGQTFLTWNEIAATGVTYRVYRSSARITSTGQAELLGVVNEFSSLNKRASDVNGSDTYYVIQAGASPLAANTGLFVNTTTNNGDFYYAVTAQNGSGENLAMTLGSNSLSNSLTETVALPAPVRQNTGSKQHYVLWTNFRDTPLIPAMANRAGITYNFMCDNIKTQLQQILNVGLYGGDNAYNDKVLSIHSYEFELSLDNPRPDLFAPPYSNQQDKVNPINTCWYGYGTDFAAQQVLTSGTVPNYTQRYMIYVVKWVLANWPQVDENRIYLTGSSFGGMGSISTGFAFPDLFAAIWSNVPRYDLGGTEWDLEKDANVTDRYQTIWGTTEQNLPTPDISAAYPDYAASNEGYNVYDRMDALYVVAHNPGKDLPVVITTTGKQDSHVGWNEKPRFIDAMQAAHQPVFFYWENTGHKFETTIFDDNVDRTELLKYRRDRSYVAVTNLSINNDPGQGDDLLPGGTVTGESRGTINGYVDWDSNTIVDTPSEYRVKVFLRSALMDQFPVLTGVQSATATLTPRRLQSFPRQANSSFAWENRRASDNALLASGNIDSDGNGLVHVDNFEISRAGNTLVLRKASGPPINQSPTAVTTASPTSGPAPLTVQFNGAASSDPDGTLTNYNWSFGDGGTSTQINPQHTFNASGTYNVTLTVTDNGGATGTASLQIQAGSSNVPPTAVASASPDSGEVPLTVLFIGSDSFDSDGTLSGFNWNFGDGMTSTGINPQHTYSSEGVYFARLVVTDDGGATDTATVRVMAGNGNAPPTAVASATPNAGKAPLNVQFSSNGSSDSDGSITSYSWNFGNGNTSTLPNPTHSYGTAGNYTATLIVTDNEGGKDTAAVAINVTSNAPPVAVASATPNAGKAPLNVQFSSNGSSDSDGSITSYSWNFGNGNTSTLPNPTHSYGTAGNYTATLIVTDNEGGKDTAAVAISVTSNAPPTAVASATPNAGKAPLNVQFSSNGSSDSDGAITSYSWNFGNGRASTLANPSQTYDSDGQYIATLIVTDNDGATDTATVAVQAMAANAPPVATAIAAPDSGTAPLSVQLYSAGSTDSDGTITTYFWNFGDGTASNLPNPQHTYTAPGTYQAMLLVTDDHGASAADSVTIKISQPFPQKPTAVATANVTSGPVPLIVQFNGSSSFDPDGTIQTYRWKYRDGTTDNVPNPVHTFQTPGQYNVRLIVYDMDGMTDSAWVVINATGVLQRPKAIAKANVLTGKAPLAVQFTGSTSSDADGTIRTYRWKFRDGTTDNVPDPLHTFQSPGLYNVRLITIDNDGLRDSSWVKVTVTENDPLPPKSISSADVTYGRAPLTVRFKGAESYDPDGTIKTFRWKFRDGTTDNVPNPVHVFQLPGDYNVRLIVYDNDDFTDSSWVVITVDNSAANLPPTAIAEAAPDSGRAPLAVQFNGAGSHDPDGVLVSWQWDFGDGASGSEASAQHTYVTPGLYAASLFVTDNDGGSDTANVTIRITGPQPPVARATGSPQNGLAPLQVQFDGTASSDADGSIASYWWDFGDGGNSSAISPSHVYTTAGSFTATLIATDSQSLRDTATVAITVTNVALPSFRVNCAGPAYTAANGRSFAADQEYKDFVPSPWGYVKDGSTKETSDPIANTSDPVLYQTQHTKSVLEYLFDLANGSYEVTLHFAEIRDEEAGFRVIDVYAENLLAVDDLDPYVAAGGKNIALTRRLTNVVVNDGQLNIRFEKANSEIRRNIAIAAIEVVPAGSVAKTGVAEAAIPTEYSLAQNYPNPFNPVTHLAFSLPESGLVQLRFYNALGQPVRKAIVRYYDAGHHTVRVNAASWPSGLYFYELRVNGFRAMRKMIVAK